MIVLGPCKLFVSDLTKKQWIILIPANYLFSIWNTYLCDVLGVRYVFSNIWHQYRCNVLNVHVSVFAFEQHRFNYKYLCLRSQHISVWFRTFHQYWCRVLSKTMYFRKGWSNNLFLFFNITLLFFQHLDFIFQGHQQNINKLKYLKLYLCINLKMHAGCPISVVVQYF